MEGYIVTSLDNDSQPIQYWSDAGFKDDITQGKIHFDIREAVSTFAGLQARFNTIEMKVFKCKSVIEIIPGNPFAEVSETEATPVVAVTAS